MDVEQIQKTLATSAAARALTEADWSHTFSVLGISPNEAPRLVGEVLDLFESEAMSPVFYDKARKIIADYFKDSGLDLGHVIAQKRASRTAKIYSQIKDHLDDVQSILDYGAGVCDLGQMIHEQLVKKVECVDFQPSPAKTVSVPVRSFEDDALADRYDAILLINVLHHDVKSDIIIAEVSNLASKKVIVIETMTEGDSGQVLTPDYIRTYMNDYLSNQFFRSQPVPVAGAYGSREAWVEKFRKHGLHLTFDRDLGFDQELIRDRHHLFVFSK